MSLLLYLFFSLAGLLVVVELIVFRFIKRINIFEYRFYYTPATAISSITELVRASRSGTSELKSSARKVLALKVLAWFLELSILVVGVTFVVSM